MASKGNSLKATSTSGYYPKSPRKKTKKQLKTVNPAMYVRPRKSRNDDDLADEACSDEGYASFTGKMLPNAQYYTVTIENTSGDAIWYVGFRNGYATTNSYPTIYDASQIENLKYMWKRIAVEDAINFDTSSVNIDSLRICRLQIGLFDITSSLGLNTKDDHVRSALCKLSPQEARALGVEDFKAEQMLTRREDNCPRDKNVATALENTSAQITSPKMYANFQ